jgi:thiamine-phosphate diphosphorylase
VSILCLVTDGRQSEAAAAAAAARDLVRLVRDAVDAGVDLVQIREPGLPGRRLFDLVLACARETCGSRTRLLVNDRLDVALAAGAAGVHLRGTSCPASRVRRHVPRGFVIGRSVHGVEDARAAERDGGLDYLVAGTVFPSRSKPGAGTLLGIDGLRRIVGAVSLPVLAIGGVTLATLPLVIDAGAAGCAAIGLFSSVPGGRDGLASVVSAARSLFDTSRPIP